jgi:hypothetical protein
VNNLKKKFLIEGLSEEGLKIEKGVAVLDEALADRIVYFLREIFNSKDEHLDLLADMIALNKYARVSFMDISRAWISMLSIMKDKHYDFSMHTSYTTGDLLYYNTSLFDEDIKEYYEYSLETANTDSLADYVSKTFGGEDYDVWKPNHEYINRMSYLVFYFLENYADDSIKFEILMLKESNQLSRDWVKFAKPMSKEKEKEMLIKGLKGLGFNIKTA